MAAPSPLLFTLLDAMDGLDQDADVVFLLTTNRAEALERALAQRPGRVDLAVEIPLPDEEARRRGSIALYAAEVGFADEAIAAAAEAAAGTTASYAKELVRRAVLRAAIAERDPVGRGPRRGHARSCRRTGPCSPGRCWAAPRARPSRLGGAPGQDEALGILLVQRRPLQPGHLGQAGAAQDVRPLRAVSGGSARRARRGPASGSPARPRARRCPPGTATSTGPPPRTTRAASAAMRGSRSSGEWIVEYQ